MEYCRQLKFDEDPDYKHCVALFEKCMKRHSHDPKVMDFTWKQNRLSKDKESLKASMMDVIKKKPKMEYADKSPGQGLGQTGADAMQGYGQSGTMMGMQ